MRFEELIESPTKSFEKACEFFDIEPSTLTGGALQKVERYGKEKRIVPQVSKRLLTRTRRIYDQFDYD
jgi:hypothetical protein